MRAMERIVIIVEEESNMKKIEDWKLALYFIVVFFGVVLLLIVSQMNLLHFQWAGMKQEFEEIKYQVYEPAVGVIKAEEWR